MPGLTYLKMLCEQIPELEVVKAFNNPVKMLEEIKNIDFDLCIMDIEMPGLDGLAVAGLLHDKGIIFTTAYKEYAAEAYDLNAIDYLRKPIQKDRLEKAVKKALVVLQKTTPERQFMQLNTNKGKALIYFDKVLLIRTSQVEKRDKIAILEEGQNLTLKNISFAELQKFLPADKFCRVNKGDIIALKAVRYFTHDEIFTTLLNDNGKELSIILGDAYKESFLGLIKQR